MARRRSSSSSSCWSPPSSVVLLASRARVVDRVAVARDARARRLGEPTPTSSADASTSTELEATGRERSDETRASRSAACSAARRGGEVVEYEPVDEEELGVTRRQFLNRGILTAVGFGVAGFGAACSASSGRCRARRLRRQGQRRQARRHPRRHRRRSRSRSTSRRPARTSCRTRRTPTLADGQEGLQARRSTTGMEQGSSRSTSAACTSVAACRCARLAVVRVPVPRLEVQPGRREEGRPGAAWPRPLRRRRRRRQHRSSTPAPSYLGPPIGTNTTGQNAEGPLCV